MGTMSEIYYSQPVPKPEGVLIAWDDCRANGRWECCNTMGPYLPYNGVMVLFCHRPINHPGKCDWELTPRELTELLYEENARFSC